MMFVGYLDCGGGMSDSCSAASRIKCNTWKSRSVAARMRLLHDACNIDLTILPTWCTVVHCQLLTACLNSSGTMSALPENLCGTT